MLQEAEEREAKERWGGARGAQLRRAMRLARVARIVEAVQRRTVQLEQRFARLDDVIARRPWLRCLHEARTRALERALEIDPRDRRDAPLKRLPLPIVEALWQP